MLKKIFKDSFIYAVLPQIPRFAGLLLLPFLTKHLTEIDYGIYGLVMAYVGGFSALKDLGMSQVFVNSFYKEPANFILVWRKLFGTLIIWKIIFTLLLILVLAIILYYNNIPNIFSILFYVGFSMLAFETILFISNLYYLLNQNSIAIGINSLISGIVALLSNYILIVHYNYGYLGFFISNFIGTGVSALLFFFTFIIKQKFYPSFEITKEWLKPYLKISLPTIPHNYSAYLLNMSDRVILDVNKVPMNEIGKYNFAYNFGTYVDMLGNAVGMAVSPFYLKLYASKNELSDKLVRKLTFVLQLLFILSCSIGCLWLKEIFELMVKNIALQKSYAIAIIIIMSYCYRPMYWAIVNKLGFEEQTSKLWRITFIGGLVNVLLNIIFVPFYGIWASVIATFISLLYIGFSGYYLKNKHIPRDYNPLLWLFSIIVLTVFIYYFRDLIWIYKIGISLILIVVSILIFYKLNLKEIITTFQNENE